MRFAVLCALAITDGVSSEGCENFADLLSSTGLFFEMLVAGCHLEHHKHVCGEAREGVLNVQSPFVGSAVTPQSDVGAWLSQHPKRARRGPHFKEQIVWRRSTSDRPHPCACRFIPPCRGHLHG